MRAEFGDQGFEQPDSMVRKRPRRQSVRENETDVVTGVRQGAEVCRCAAEIGTSEVLAACSRIAGYDGCRSDPQFFDPIEECTRVERDMNGVARGRVRCLELENSVGWE